jgi:glycerol kinase
MAYQTHDVLKIMEAECGAKMTALKVDGGASANNLLMQFQADILGLPIVRPSLVETTALGAANLAALSIGLYSSTDDIKRSSKIERTFEPEMNDATRDAKISMWQKAVERSLGWAK